MTDLIDTARAEGIALGLAMALEKVEDHFPGTVYLSSRTKAIKAILAVATIPPHVAAARVLLDMPQIPLSATNMMIRLRKLGGYRNDEILRAALEQIAKDAAHA